MRAKVFHLGGGEVSPHLICFIVSEVQGKNSDFMKGENTVPNVNKKYRSKGAKAPPIDWLWAAVLERKTVMGYTAEELAAVGGISYPQMRQYLRISPWDWHRSARERVCKELGISITYTPAVSERIGVTIK